MKLKRSSLLIKLVILALVVYAAVTLVSLRAQIAGKEAESQALAAAITSTKQENQRLEEAIASVDSDAGVEEIARNKLGLVAPGEIVFRDVGK